MPASADRQPLRRRIQRRWIAIPAIAVAVVAGAVTLTVGANASTLLSADFDSGAAGWSKSGGTWTVSTDGSRAFRQSDAASPNARQLSGDAGWTTYLLTARVKATALPQPGSAVAVLAHATTATSFDRLALLGSGQAQLQAVQSGRVRVLATLPMDAAAGGWHTLQVQESAGQVSAWVDGTFVGAGTSQSGSGRIGLQTLSAGADFDDVTVDSSLRSVPATTTTVSTPPAGTTGTAAPSSSTTPPAGTTGSAAPSSSTTTGSGAAAAFTPTGYAAVGGTTTGGAGGREVTVTSASGLATEAARSGVATITVSGTFTCAGDIAVSSDKTVIGAGASSGLTGCGLAMKGVRNVVVRNLRISMVRASNGSGDAIHIENSTRIWIDHNDLSSDQTHGKDYYDGLLDITHGSDDVTVSWNYLHDHYKASLVGHSDDNAAEDTGKLHVTYHHNWFANINSRMPSLRFGTGHVYDNYFLNGDTGVHSRMGAQMLVQNNVFRAVATPILTTKDSPVDGFVNQSGNDLGGGTNQITRVGTFTAPPYAYTLDPTSAVISLVTAGAGTGHLG